MKTLHIFLVLLFLLAGTAAAQNILTVDNNGATPGGNNYFTDLQDAIDAAVTGDFIYIMPSPESYGNVDIEDRDGLTLIGLGYNTAAINMNFNYGSQVGTIDVDNSQNLVFKGLKINNMSLDNANTTDPSSNIVVGGVELRSLNVSFVDRLSVSNSYIENITLSNNDNSVIQFRRCIINPAGSSLSDYSDIINGNFHNSVFFDFTFKTISNSTFTNNIFLKSQRYQYADHRIKEIADNNNTFRNNLLDLEFPINEGSNFGENNVVETALNPSDIFADTAVSDNTTVFDLDWDMTPKLSTLLNAGTDGTHIGPAGGSAGYYRYSAFTLPYVFEFIIPDQVKEGEDIQVTIKARAGEL